jgi:predicted Zn finger-like uncharacterized protein
MPQITQCPHCRGQLQVRDENLGQTIRCPLCNGLFKIAAPAPPPSPPPPPPAPPPAVNVEVIEPPAPAPPPPPPASPPAPKPKPSGAVRKPASKPAPKPRPTPGPAPAQAERPRRPKSTPPPAPPAAVEEENPFALGGPLAGAVGGEPAALNFEEGQAKPHRGNVVLGLGIAGLVFSFCCFPAGYGLGGTALVLGSRDLRLMARRRMDRAGKGPTRVGQILGIVALVVSTINVAVTIWRVVVFFSASA